MKAHWTSTLRALAAASILSLFAIGCDGEATSGDSQGGAPMLTVRWTHDLPCNVNVRSDVTVTLDAVDDLDAPADLVYSGSVMSCMPALTGPSNALSCPQIMPYTSSATVTDTDGNSDTVVFSMVPCEDGQAT